MLSSETVLDALEQARAWRPDAVLIDLMSTADDGFDAIRVLRDDSHMTAVPIVAVMPNGGDESEWRHLADQITIAARAGKATVSDLLALLDQAATGSSAPGREIVTGERVLVVEDNELNLKLVRGVLEHAGLEVRSVGTAEAALDVAAQQPPDLILMDLQLPGMDGFAGLAALRADLATASIPVVALTALAMPHDRERGAHRRIRRIPGEAHQRSRPALAGPRGHRAREERLMTGPSTTAEPRVLVVDDLETNIRLLDAVLTPRGHQVTAARSGDEALAILGRQDVDIVLLDIVMPGMDG